MSIFPSSTRVTQSKRLNLSSKAYILGRPFWECHFMNGQVVDETQTDWLHLPRLGRKELRLYCPNRDVAVVGGTENNNGLRVGDNSGLLFQLKGATMRVGIGTETDFHMIGIVYGTNGECKFWVWDCHTKRLLGPLDDNRYAMKFANIGELSARHLGLEE